MRRRRRRRRRVGARRTLVQGGVFEEDEGIAFGLLSCEPRGRSEIGMPIEEDGFTG